MQNIFLTIRFILYTDSWVVYYVLSCCLFIKIVCWALFYV